MKASLLAIMLLVGCEAQPQPPRVEELVITNARSDTLLRQRGRYCAIYRDRRAEVMNLNNEGNLVTVLTIVAPIDGTTVCRRVR